MIRITVSGALDAPGAMRISISEVKSLDPLRETTWTYLVMPGDGKAWTSSLESGPSPRPQRHMALISALREHAYAKWE